LRKIGPLCGGLLLLNIFLQNAGKVLRKIGPLCGGPLLPNIFLQNAGKVLKKIGPLCGGLLLPNNLLQKNTSSSTHVIRKRATFCYILVI